MFTAVAQKNLGDAESYFDEHLAQNDYYAAGEIRPDQWIGAGAERMGLKNVVTREHFHALCENQNPNDSEHLTQRQKAKDQRRVSADGRSFGKPECIRRCCKRSWRTANRQVTGNANCNNATSWGPIYRRSN
jgi:hypothetical protein